MENLVSNPLLLWLAIGGLLLAAEVGTGSGWLLWPAGAAALTAAITALMPLNLASQAVLFALLTIVSTLAGRRFFPRHRGRGDINDTSARLAGSEGVVIEPFREGRGRVLVDGKEWAARMAGEASLAPGAKIVVVAVGGAQLDVRPA